MKTIAKYSKQLVNNKEVFIVDVQKWGGCPSF